MMQINKPYFELYPSINCSGVVLVDDVPVFKFLGKDTKDGLMDGPVPINHILLNSGKHKVSGKMYPRFGNKTLIENDGMSINFNVSDFDNWKETKQKFMPEIKSPDAYFDQNNKITSKIKGLTFFEIGTEIEIELPFVLDGWQKSIDLSKIDNDKLFQEVFNKYVEVHSIIKSHNASKFLNISKEKEDLQSQAFYFDDKRKEEIRQSIFNLFNQKLKILPINKQDLKLELWGYGKLVTLVRNDGTSAIQFERDIDKGKRNIEFDIKLHMRSKEKGLTII